MSLSLREQNPAYKPLIMFTIYKYRGKEKKDKLWIRVSKKVSKKAVDRNRLRRQIKAALRELTNQNLKKYIISVKKEVLGQPYAIIKEELAKALPKERWTTQKEKKDAHRTKRTRLARILLVDPALGKKRTLY